MADQVFTYAGAEFFVSDAKQNADLTKSGFEAITASGWIKVGKVGALPTHGVDTNFVSYDMLDTTVSLNAKGISNAGGGELECARDSADLGQDKLTTIGAPDYVDNHAFMIVFPNGDKRYLRGLVGGPSYSGGRNEDFDLAVYNLTFNQVPVDVPAP